MVANDTSGQGLQSVLKHSRQTNFFEEIIGVWSPVFLYLIENNEVFVTHPNYFIFTNRCCEWAQMTRLVKDYNMR
jgi:hypothetical protein